MTKTFQWAQVNIEMLKKVSYDDKAGNSGRGEIRLFDRLRPSISKNLVLDIRRTHIFEDAMKQLWRRKPGELMKPLKVRMGKAEGEEGVDLGGVQQEFFRLVIAEALNPKYGEHLSHNHERNYLLTVNSQVPLRQTQLPRCLGFSRGR